MKAFDLDAHIADRLGSIPGVVSAYLFGSEAEHRAHEESDVDVGVLLDWTVCPDARTRFEARLNAIAELSRGLAGREVDVVILNDAPPQFGRRIVTQGRRVFCTDPALDHAFVRDVQLRAADLEPFLRRMRALKLGSIGRA